MFVNLGFIKYYFFAHKKIIENAGNTRPIKGTKIEGKLRSVIEWVPWFEFHIRIFLYFNFFVFLPFYNN